MKRSLVLLFALLLASISLNAFTVSFFAPNEDDPELIEVAQQTGGDDPNQQNTILIQAYKTSSSVYVYLSIFTGNTFVTITNGIGAIVASDFQHVNGSAMIVLDISSLPAGQYYLSINAGGIYTGVFQK